LINGKSFVTAAGMRGPDFGGKSVYVAFEKKKRLECGQEVQGVGCSRKVRQRTRFLKRKGYSWNHPRPIRRKEPGSFSEKKKKNIF